MLKCEMVRLISNLWHWLCKHLYCQLINWSWKSIILPKLDKIWHFWNIEAKTNSYWSIIIVIGERKTSLFSLNFLKRKFKKEIMKIMKTPGKFWTIFRKYFLTPLHKVQIIWNSVRFCFFFFFDFFFSFSFFSIFALGDIHTTYCVRKKMWFLNRRADFYFGCIWCKS